MAKKSHKRCPRWRKENVGCMRSLISIFDFRQVRSTQRLLSDKKLRSSRNLGIRYSRNKVDFPCSMEDKHGDVDSVPCISDTEAEEGDRVNLDVSIINKLMEKKLAKAHNSRNEFSTKVELIKAELGNGANAEKSYKEATKNGVVVSNNNLDAAPSLISQQSDYPKTLSSGLDLGASMLDYCLQCEENRLEYNKKAGQYPSPAGDLKMSERIDTSVTIHEKAIVELTEAFLTENSINSSKLDGSRKVHEPKDIVNALEMLKSNKELFLKLLQDPNSLIQKQIQGHQNVHFSKPSKPDQNQLLGELSGTKKFQKQSGHYLFRKNDKLTVVSQSNECNDAKGLHRIVVLKPSRSKNQNLSHTIAPIASIASNCGLKNQEDRVRLSSLFSLKEIRRSFRNVIGASRKEMHPIAMDGILHKIPYGKHITNETETSCRRENAESEGEKRSDTKKNQKKQVFSVASTITDKTKKLSKNAAPRMFYTEADFCDEARKRLAEFLRIGIESESLPAIPVSKSLGRILSFSGFNYLTPRLTPAREKEAESLKENTSLLLYHSKQKSSAEHLDLLRHKESFDSTNKIQEAKNEIMEIVEVEDKLCIKTEAFSQLGTQSVVISSENDLPSRMFEEEGSFMLLKPEQSEARFDSSTPSTPSALSSAEIQEPNDTECAIDDTNRPSPISFLEPLFFEDIKIPTSMITAHAASGSTDSEANMIKCTEFDEALLFDELEVCYSMFIEDPKLLFDSIDEVLSEIKERHFNCTPWVSFINPIWPIHKHKYFMKEACRRINRHLDVQFPCTLVQAVKKDLDGTIWIDLQFEAESAVGEIGDAILDYLFEETALALWD